MGGEGGRETLPIIRLFRDGQVPMGRRHIQLSSVDRRLREVLHSTVQLSMMTSRDGEPFAYMLYKADKERRVILNHKLSVKYTEGNGLYSSFGPQKK